MKTLIKTGLGVGALAAALSVGVFVGQATADQPHMENALDALRTARSELELAVANKGGHRERAIGYVDSAIGEVREGMRYAD